MTTRTKLHPDNGTLERYALGHLADGELERVEEHLLVCAFCQDELTLVDSQVCELKDALRDLRTQPEPEAVVGSWRWLLAIPRTVMAGLLAIPRPVAAAGALAAFLLIMVLPFARFQSGVASPSEVRLETYRGTEPVGTAHAKSNNPLHLRFTNPHADATYRVEIVNEKGSRVWSGPASHDNAGLFVDTQAFGSGKYWVRLFGANNLQLDEYALELK